MSAKKMPPGCCTAAEELLQNIEHATARIDDAIAHNAAALATLFDQGGRESVLEVLAKVLNSLDCARHTAKGLVAAETKGSEAAE